MMMGMEVGIGINGNMWEVIKALNKDMTYLIHKLILLK